MHSKGRDFSQTLWLDFGHVRRFLSGGKSKVPSFSVMFQASLCSNKLALAVELMTCHGLPELPFYKTLLSQKGAGWQEQDSISRLDFRLTVLASLSGPRVSKRIIPFFFCYCSFPRLSLAKILAVLRASGEALFSPGMEEGFFFFFIWFYFIGALTEEQQLAQKMQQSSLFEVRRHGIEIFVSD